MPGGECSVPSKRLKMVHNNLVIKCHISSVVIYVKKESHLVKNMFYTVSISFSVSYFEGVICVRNALWEADAAVSREKHCTENLPICV